ncbi:MAG: asparagine synthase (glutamine-hydrolyzing), partial [Acidobacteriota bacterium]
DGPDALTRLNGIFALALWDAGHRRLLLARDPFGVKPLYYAIHGRILAFASEIKALLTLPGLRRELDPEALDLYLSFRFVPPPWTLFRGIRKLGPGERLLAQGDAPPRLESYVPAPAAVDPRPTREEWVEELRAALEPAIRRQLMADVPVGVLLSGGADSAAMLAVAARETAAPVASFTVGFEDAPALDEVPEAGETARRLASPHRHVRISDADYRRRLVTALHHLDEPVATPSVAPFDALCELAATDHKAVLSGQGADEPLGGYPRHRAEKLSAGLLGRLLSGPCRLAAWMRPGSETLERAARSLAVRDVARRHQEILALFPLADRRRLRGTEGPDPLDLIAHRSAPAAHLDPVSRFLFLDSRFGLPDDLLLYADKIAMAHSLEVRVPFLDLEFVRLVERIPGSLRIGGRRGKSLLRDALRTLVPGEVLARPKRNFSPPDRAWLRDDDGGGGPSIQWLQEPDAAMASYCDGRAIDRLVEEQRAGRRDRRRQLFALLALETWHRIFLDGRLVPPASLLRRTDHRYNPASLSVP